MIALYFSHWRHRATDCLKAQEIADQIRHERDFDMIQDVFLCWNERFRSLADMKKKAVDLHQIHLVR